MVFLFYLPPKEDRQPTQILRFHWSGSNQRLFFVLQGTTTEKVEGMYRQQGPSLSTKEEEEKEEEKEEETTTRKEVESLEEEKEEEETTMGHR